MFRKVIVLKDLPSNVLSEAILILKDDINIKKDIKKEVKNVKYKSAVDEAQCIIEEYMYKLEHHIEKKGFFHKILDKVKGCSNN